MKTETALRLLLAAMFALGVVLAILAIFVSNTPDALAVGAGGLMGISIGLTATWLGWVTGNRRGGNGREKREQDRLENEWFVVQVRNRITGKRRYTFGTTSHESSDRYRWQWLAQIAANNMNRYYKKRNDWVRDDNDWTSR